VYTASADTIGGSPWDTIAPCPRGTTGLVLGTTPIANEVDSLFIVGGDFRGSAEIYGYYLYNVNQNSWTTVQNPPTTLGGQGSGLLFANDTFYLAGGSPIGGWNNGSRGTCYFDHNTNGWVLTGKHLVMPTHSFASAVLPGSILYVSGGRGIPNSVHMRSSCAFDDKAPYISFTNPANKAVSVPYDQVIVIGFSEKIDTSMGFDFSLSPDPGLLLGVWNNEQDSIYIFHDDLDVNTTYYVTLDDVYDTMGFSITSNSIPNPFGFSTGVTGVNGLAKSTLSTKLGALNTNIVSSFVRFDYAVSNTADVKMEVYSINGALVKTLVNNKSASGTHKVIWDLKDNGGKLLPSGTYIYKFTSGSYNTSGKLTIIK